MKCYVMLFLWMLVIYYLVDLGNMIEELSMMVLKTPMFFVKDGVKVALGPCRLEKTLKPDKGEGTNLLTKSGLEKELEYATEACALVVLEENEKRVSHLQFYNHFLLDFLMSFPRRFRMVSLP